MSETINQTFSLDTSRTVEQLNRAINAAAKLAQGVADMNAEVAKAIRANEDYVRSNDAQYASMTRIQKAVYDYRSTIGQLNTVGQNLKATFQNFNLGGAIGDASYLNAVSQEMARLGQTSGLTYAQVVGVYKAIASGEQPSQQAEGKIRALAESFAKLRDAAIELDQFKNANKNLVENAKSAALAAGSYRALFREYKNNQQAISELKVVYAALSEEQNRGLKLTDSDKAAKKDILVTIKQIEQVQGQIRAQIRDINGLTEAGAGKGAIYWRGQHIVLSQYIQGLNALRDSQLRFNQDADRMERGLRSLTGFTFKVDPTTQMELDKITNELVKLQRASGMTRKEWASFTANVVSGSKNVAREQVDLASKVKSLYGQFEKVTKSSETYKQSTFKVGEAVRQLFLNMNKLGDSASSKLKTKIERLADSTAKLAQKSGLTKTVFMELLAAMERRDYGANVVRQNKKIADSLYNILLQSRAVYKELAREQAASVRGEAGVSLFRQANPSTNNLVFARETERAEQAIYKLASAANVTEKELKEMISLGTVGAIKRYVDEVHKAYGAVDKLTPAQKKARIVDLEAARAKEKLATDITRVISSYKQLIAVKKNWAVEAVKSISLVNVSWSSYIRYFITRTLYRSFTQLISAFRQGAADAFELQKRIAEIRTISQDSSKSTAAWTQELKQLSDVFPQSTLDIAEGAYQALSNQVANAANVTGFMREALTLSITALSSTAQAVNALSSVLNAYGKDASQARDVSAQLFKIVELGRVRLEDVADTLGNVTVLAAQLGISFEEVGASLTTLTRQGITPATAMTLLRNVILKLIGPTENMKKVFAEWGVNSAEAAVATYGFFGVLQKLAKQTGGDLTEINELFSRIRGTIGFAGLTGGDALNQFGSDLREITTSMEAYEEAQTRAFDNMAQRVRIEGQKIKNYFSADLGTAFIGFLDKANTSVGGASKLIKELTGNVLSLGDAFVQVAGLLRYASGLLKTLVPVWLFLVVGAKSYVKVTSVLNSKLVETAKGFFAAKKQGQSFSQALAAVKLSAGSLWVAMGLAAAAIVAYIAVSIKMRRDALERTTKAAHDHAEAFLASREAVKQATKELTAYQESQKGLTETIQRQLQLVTASRAANFAFIEGAKDRVKELGKEFESAFKKLEGKAVEAGLNAVNNALEQTKDQIKSINDTIFDRNFLEPIAGYKDVAEEIAASTAKAESYFQRAYATFRSAKNASAADVAEIYSNARAYNNTAIGALEEAEKASTSRYREVANRIAEVKKELEGLDSNPFTSLADLDKKRTSQKTLGEELIKLQKELTTLEASSNSLRGQINQAINEQLQREKAITAELRTRQALEEEKKTRVEAENTRVGDVLTGLTGFSTENIAEARKQFAQLKSEFEVAMRVLALRGPEGIQAATSLRGLFNEVSATYKAAEENFAFDQREKGFNLVAERLAKSLDEQKAALDAESQKLASKANEIIEATQKSLDLSEKFTGSIFKDATSLRVDDLVGKIKTVRDELEKYRSSNGDFTATNSERFRELIASLSQYDSQLRNLYQFEDQSNAKLATAGKVLREEILEAIEKQKEAADGYDEALKRQIASQELLGQEIASVSELFEKLKNSDIAESLGEDIRSTLEEMANSVANVNTSTSEAFNSIALNGPTAIQTGIIEPLNRAKLIVDGIKIELADIVRQSGNINIPIRGSTPITQANALGGWVNGYGAADSVTARLSPGEFVVNRSAAQDFAPVLEALNGNRSARTTSNSTTNYGNVSVNIYGDKSSGNVSPETARKIADLIYREQSRGRVR